MLQYSPQYLIFCFVPQNWKRKKKNRPLELASGAEIRISESTKGLHRISNSQHFSGGGTSRISSESSNHTSKFLKPVFFNLKRIPYIENHCIFLRKYYLFVTKAKEHESQEAWNRRLTYGSFRIDIINVNISVLIGEWKEDNVPYPSSASKSYHSKTEEISTLCISNTFRA